MNQFEVITLRWATQQSATKSFVLRPENTLLYYPAWFWQWIHNKYRWPMKAPTLIWKWHNRIQKIRRHPQTTPFLLKSNKWTLCKTEEKKKIKTNASLVTLNHRARADRRRIVHWMNEVIWYIYKTRRRRCDTYNVCACRSKNDLVMIYHCQKYRFPVGMRSFNTPCWSYVRVQSERVFHARMIVVAESACVSNTMR